MEIDFAICYYGLTRSTQRVYETHFSNVFNRITILLKKRKPVFLFNAHSKNTFVIERIQKYIFEIRRARF